MGIRETVNQNPWIGYVLVICMVLVAAGVVIFTLRPDPTAQATGPMQAFFTVDDGQTTFSADMFLVPPFEHQGRTAVRAHKFQCPGGEPFVVFLERFTPEGQAAMQQLRQIAGPPDPALAMRATLTGRELKRPGEPNWTRADREPAATEIQTPPNCPDGTRPEMFLPE